MRNVKSTVLFTAVSVMELLLDMFDPTHLSNTVQQESLQPHYMMHFNCTDGFNKIMLML